MNTSATPEPVIVVGAGITGLTAAHTLHRAGVPVVVLEASHRVGGSIISEREGEWLMEGGPNSLLRGSPEVERLLRELELTDRVIAASPNAKHRFLVRNGQPHAVPTSPWAFLTSPLLSLSAKMGLMRDLFRKPYARTDDISLAALVDDHFGSEIVNRVLQPVISGIYAGDVEQLSAQHAFPQLWQAEANKGSLIRGMAAAAKAKRLAATAQGIPRPPRGVISFPDGLQTLTDALLAALPVGTVRTGQAVRAMHPGASWRVVLVEGTEIAASAVVLAIPAPALAKLRLGEATAPALPGLAEIANPPVSSLFLGYRRDAVSHPLNGFGMLVARLEHRQMLGVLFSSSLFPDRAPADHVALTVLTGGMLQPDIARLPTAELLAKVQPDLAELLGVTGEPAFMRHRFWPQAIPQYNLGYENHLAAMDALTARHQGLFLGGNAHDGISIPHCIASGYRLAAKVLDAKQA